MGEIVHPDKGSYFKYCGQDFWELISNDEEFYIRIIQPLGHDAKRRNEEFVNKYGAVINRFSKKFSELFCNEETGEINWKALVSFSSARVGKPP